MQSEKNVAFREATGEDAGEETGEETGEDAPY